jgi:hypothetical protein
MFMNTLHTSCDVAGALVKLGAASGGFIPDTKMHSPRYLSPELKLVGPDQTTKFELLAEKADKPKITGHYVRDQ